MIQRYVFFLGRFLLKKGASLTAVNCDGDVPLDIALDETTESLLHDYTQKQGELFAGTQSHPIYFIKIFASVMQIKSLVVFIYYFMV